MNIRYFKDADSYYVLFDKDKKKDSILVKIKEGITLTTEKKIVDWEIVNEIVSRLSNCETEMSYEQISPDIMGQIDDLLHNYYSTKDKLLISNMTLLRTIKGVSIENCDDKNFYDTVKSTRKGQNTLPTVIKWNDKIYLSYSAEDYDSISTPIREILLNTIRIQYSPDKEYEDIVVKYDNNGNIIEAEKLWN